MVIFHLSGGCLQLLQSHHGPLCIFLLYALLEQPLSLAGYGTTVGLLLCHILCIFDDGLNHTVCFITHLCFSAT